MPNNVEAWPEVRDRLNQILRGWCAYFRYGTTAQAYQAVDYYVYESVRHYLRRRHQVQSRGTNSCFSRDAVYGRLGFIPLRSSPDGISFVSLVPPRSPNLNAFAERWIRSIKHECLSKLVLFGEASLRRTLTEFLRHYHFRTQPPRKREHAPLPCPWSSTVTSDSGCYLSRPLRRIAELLPA